MSFNIIILTGLFYLIPNNLEICHHNYTLNGDMSLTNVYLDVKIKRDTFYKLGIASLVFLFLPFKMLRLFVHTLSIFSLIIYFRSIKKWHRYL
jgi:hypothetical protein